MNIPDLGKLKTALIPHIRNRAKTVAGGLV